MDSEALKEPNHQEEKDVEETTIPENSYEESVHTLVVNEQEEIEVAELDKTSEGQIEDSEEYETPDLEENETTDDRGGDDSDVESESSNGSQDVPTEREEGDGQESEKKEKKLDHDEDKRDPQYIPKKGNFYEHDDRTSEGEEPIAGKKQPSQKAYDSKERWGHDLYEDRMQSPKTREELIEQYGYDIRLEEGPPKARRRRRYGRGPNKYTRRWEEEEAYTKTRGSWRGRGRGRISRHSTEDFPPLPAKEIMQKGDEKKTEEKGDDLKKESSRKLEIKEDKKETVSVSPAVRKMKTEDKQVHNPSRGRGRGRGRGSQPFKTGAVQRQSSTAEEDIAMLSQHFSEAVINVDNKSIPSQRASSVPPSINSDSNCNGKSQQMSDDAINDKSGESKSKRYSSQRQRSLPQGTSGVIVQQQTQAPPPPPQRFIQADQQQYFHQVGLEATAGTGSSQFPNQTPGYATEVPVISFMSPAGHQFHQPLPTYLQPTFLPPPPIATPPRGPEVYQGPTGITYYNTQSQVSRPVSTSRRVRLAIPIVAPPPESS